MSPPRMPKFFTIPFPFFFVIACGDTPDRLAPLQLPAECRQVIEVSTARIDAFTGNLQRFERDQDGAWVTAGEPVPVTIGRSGLAWGRGLHLEIKNAKPRKHEGDGKAPAGIFSLGTAFGYDAEAPPGCRMPYRQATGNDYFVDSDSSAQYNQWVEHEGGFASAKKKWTSVEQMRRPDSLYEFGIVVHHNTPPVPGEGSAIFIHVWAKPGQPTAGCTAMSRPDLLQLLAWLDPQKKPLLVQSTEQDFKTLKHK